MRLQRIGKYMGTIATGDKKQFCALCRMQSRFQRFATSQGNGCGRQAAMTISIPDIGGIAQMAAAQIAAERSEERRVGKEGRSRWSPDQSKKKVIDQLRHEQKEKVS